MHASSFTYLGFIFLNLFPDSYTSSVKSNVFEPIRQNYATGEVVGSVDVVSMVSFYDK